MAKDNRHEPKHEYNMFLDRQLQNVLLDIDEQSEKGSRISKSRQDNDLAGWDDNFHIKAAKPEKIIKPPKESKPDSRDSKLKDKSYVFNHYRDFRMYMLDYKQNYAFSKKHCVGDSRQVLSDHQVHMLFQKHKQSQVLKQKSESKRKESRNDSDSNIVTQKAQKYRLSPTLLRLTDKPEQVETGIRARASSAKSAREMVKPRNINNLNLTQVKRIPVVQPTRLQQVHASDNNALRGISPQMHKPLQKSSTHGAAESTE